MLSEEWMIWLRKVSACAALLRPEGSRIADASRGDSRPNARPAPAPARPALGRLTATTRSAGFDFFPYRAWRTPAMRSSSARRTLLCGALGIDATRGTEQCGRMRLAATSSSCLALLVI
jgi:hypothetical protein